MEGNGRQNGHKGERRAARALAGSPRNRRFRGVPLARSSLYRLLARAYSYPDAQGAMALREALARAQAMAPLLPRPVAAALEGLATGLAGPEPGALEGSPPDLRFGGGPLEAEYLRLFTHVLTPDCPPYETAYTARHLFQQSQDLADMAGFYRAFGLEAGGERPDHIAVELEFMGFLAYKEAYALRYHGADKAALCRRAQRRFLAAHLGCWAPRFAGLLAAKAGATAPAVAGQGPYRQLALLTEEFVASELKALRAKPAELSSPLPLAQMADPWEEIGDCGPCEEEPAPPAPTCPFALAPQQPRESRHEPRHRRARGALRKPAARHSGRRGAMAGQGR